MCVYNQESIPISPFPSLNRKKKKKKKKKNLKNILSDLSLILPKIHKQTLISKFNNEY
jgi:hypothetical protein